MKFPGFSKIIPLFLFLIPLVLIFKVGPSWAFLPQTERKIIVFRPEVAVPLQEELLTRLKISPFRSLPLVNARVAHLSIHESSLLTQDPRVLRVDPDVQVYALPRTDRCVRYPWLPGCSKTTPTPTPTRIPTPTQIPTTTPTAGPSPTPTPSTGSVPTSTPTAFPTATATPTPTSEFQPLPWGIARIKADQAWPTSDGSGVKVAVVDTGIDRDHPDLKNNLAGCLNFIQSWRTCEDDNGHGTHVSGIIAAENNSFGVVGVAPRAKIYSLKVLNSQGSGYLSDIIEALDWAIANKVQVVNMSLGTSSDIASFKDAVEKVSVAGIVQVAAAGNSGPGDNTVNYPAAYPQVIAVAATDKNDQVPSWSSRGPQVDLAAPGKEINSTWLGGGYKIISGTSMSSPHVAGVVALRLEDHPAEGPTVVESLLESNSDPLGFDPTVAGAGLVNAYRVVSVP